MRKFLYSAILLGALQAHASDCPAPAICKDIHEKYDEARENLKDHGRFKKFVALLKTAAESKCDIPGVKVKVPAYRVCYDAGFTLKTNEKGEQVVDQNFKGPKDQMQVFDWYTFADKSKFPEGRKVTRGKAFQATLDGAWAEMFTSD